MGPGPLSKHQASRDSHGGVDTKRQALERAPGEMPYKLHLIHRAILSLSWTLHRLTIYLISFNSCDIWLMLRMRPLLHDLLHPFLAMQQSRMRSNQVWMRSNQVARASGCQCQSRNSPGFDPRSSDTVESEGWQMKQC